MNVGIRKLVDKGCAIVGGAIGAIGGVVGIARAIVGGAIGVVIGGGIGGAIGAIGAIGVVIGGGIGGAIGAIGGGIGGAIGAIGGMVGIAGDIVGMVGIGGAIGGAIGGGIGGAIAILGILTTHPYRNLISGLPPEYEALIECESEEMDIKKPEDIVESVEDDLEYIEQKQRAEYELTQDGCDILDCQELGQKLKHAGYVQLNQTDGDNSTFEITEEGQKIIERNDDLCEVLKDDPGYIEQRQEQVGEYELTEDGYPEAIESRQRIEKTNLNLYVIAVSALSIGFSPVISMGSPIFALFIPVGVLLIILPLARSKAWTR